ncbi:MAG: HAMP domain-containing sensor histidine kinase [Thermostichus sp. DG_1_6_bins_120]
MTALNTLAKLLQKRLPPEDRNHWIGLSIEQECKHLQNLLLEFERSDGLLGTLQVEPLSLAELLREWIPVYQAVAESQGHHFQAEIPSPLPLMQADARALRQILDNLIDNACKYTPSPGQIRLKVRLQPDISPKRVEICICDNGPGIHPENLERIFDPFFRVDPSKPGQGLGLAISRDLATQMGGHLWVDTQGDQEPGQQGSCFCLSLPLANS